MPMQWAQNACAMSSQADRPCSQSNIGRTWLLISIACYSRPSSYVWSCRREKKEWGSFSPPILVQYLGSISSSFVAQMTVTHSLLHVTRMVFECFLQMSKQTFAHTNDVYRASFASVENYSSKDNTTVLAKMGHTTQIQNYKFRSLRPRRWETDTILFVNSKKSEWNFFFSEWVELDCLYIHKRFSELFTVSHSKIRSSILEFLFHLLILCCLIWMITRFSYSRKRKKKQTLEPAPLFLNHEWTWDS